MKESERRRVEGYIFNGITSALAAWAKDTGSERPLYYARSKMTEAAMKEFDLWLERHKGKKLVQ